MLTDKPSEAVRRFFKTNKKERQFVGQKWVGYLNDNNIRYFIRLRNNFKVKCQKKQTLIPAWHYFNHLKIRQIQHYSKILEINGEHCYLSVCKTIREGKQDFLIIISYNKPEEALEYYAQRWQMRSIREYLKKLKMNEQIESMFRVFKSSGFNLEDTHVTHQDRLSKLVMLTMITFVWCYQIGDYVDQNLKPIKIKKHGRRAISIFRYGLDLISRNLISVVNKFALNFLKFLWCT